MHEIGKLLPSAFKKQVRHADPRWIEILIPLWPRIAGKTIARHCQPSTLESGTLTLRTDCSTWTTQLRQMADQIRAQINNFLAQSVVKKVRITLEPPLHLLPPRRSGPLPSERRPVGVNSAVDTSPIPDPEIAQILAKSFAKYFARERR